MSYMELSTKSFSTLVKQNYFVHILPWEIQSWVDSLNCGQWEEVWKKA